MRQRFESRPLVVAENQRNFGTSRSHAHLLVEQYERGRATCFTFYWDRTLGSPCPVALANKRVPLDESENVYFDIEQWPQTRVSCRRDVDQAQC
jgi:hypothetical protein